MRPRVFALVLAALALYLLYAAHDSPALAPYVSLQRPLPSARPTPAPSHYCETATLGALLVSDSDGYVCERFHLLPADRSGCCDPGRPRQRYVCAGCVASRGGLCCALYEHCVSCCTGAPNPFHQCVEDCRTSSRSLDASGRQYRDAEHRYCAGERTVSESPSASAPPVGPAPSAVQWLDI